MGEWRDEERDGGREGWWEGGARKRKGNLEGGKRKGVKKREGGRDGENTLQ